MIIKINNFSDEELEIVNSLSCKQNELHIYLKDELPERLHFHKNRRIEKIVLDMPPGYTAQIDSNWTLNGTHGYDNHYSLMNVSK